MKGITGVREGQVWYTASSFGRCIRSLVASRLGYDPAPPPPSLQAIFDAGHEAEDLCVDVLRAMGWVIHSQQDEVALPIETKYGLVIVVGHLDGIYDASEIPHIDGQHPDASDGILEIKSQGADSWERYESGDRGNLWDIYAWQASIYMHAKQLPLTWVRWHRDSTEGHPIFATQTLLEPPYSIDDIRARIERVESYVVDGFLPDCEPEPQFGCPFFYLHDTESETEFERATLLPGLEDLVVRYNSYRTLEQNAKKGREQVRDEIYALMGEANVTKAFEAGSSVTLVENKRIRPDEEAMKADGIDVEKYKRETVYITPRVTYNEK